MTCKALEGVSVALLLTTMRSKAMNGMEDREELKHP